MLAVVSPLRSNKDERETGGFTIGCGRRDDFPDFSDESIDFDDLFVGMDEGDVLPDLEMDPELLAEFSLSGGEDSSEICNNNNSKDAKSPCFSSDEKLAENSSKDSGSGFGWGSSSLIQGEEILSKRDDSVTLKPSQKESDRGRKSSRQSKNSQGKRKVKVDWTPELHRRFVQAVEQLGVDKAVPSRILEIMGIDCLTRHNIASHLQKYRSHWKHLLAREAEAASWSQRRQMYDGATGMEGGGASKRDTNPWLAPAPPTMGFPRMAPMPHFRPLHVWGHPSMDRPLMPLLLPPPPPHVWAPLPSPHPPPPPPPLNPSFWHSHHQRAPNSLTQCAPYFPQPIPSTRYPTPHAPVPGIPPPHAMYKLHSSIGAPTPPTGKSCPHPPFDFQPSKESVDAAIGDILAKPWQPVPLGLKPPALDSVLVELQRQGIQKIPPTCV